MNSFSKAVSLKNLPPRRAVQYSQLCFFLVTALTFNACDRIAQAQEVQQPSDQPILQAVMQQSWQNIPNLGNQWISFVDNSVSSDTIDAKLALLNSSDEQSQASSAQFFAIVSSKLSEETKLRIELRLLELLRDKSRPRELRQQLASAAIAVHSGEKSKTADLWNLTLDNPTIRPLVERLLIRLKSDLGRQVWDERLDDAKTNERDLLLAFQGLAAIGSVESSPKIAALIEHERVSQPLMLQAAEALGQLSNSGQEVLAEKCLKSRYAAGEAMAARLIINHPSPEAGRIAAQLITSKLLPARRLAFHWHAKFSPQALDLILEKLIEDVDGGVRWLALDRMSQTNDVVGVRLLSKGLSDELPDNRRRARDGLVERASVESLSATVLENLNASLQTEFGPGSEQAIEAAVRLKNLQFNGLLIQLLDHSLAVVRVRAAWGLQELGCVEPEQLSAIHEYCQRLTDKHLSKSLTQIEGLEAQWAHLLSVLGKAEYKPAESMLRKYVDKGVLPTVPRASGIWSLGAVLRNSQDSGLSSALEARMLDNGPMGEDYSVRYAAAIAIGNIAAPSCRNSIIKSMELPPSPVGLANQWALEQLAPKPK